MSVAIPDTLYEPTKLVHDKLCTPMYISIVNKMPEPRYI